MARNKAKPGEWIRGSVAKLVNDEELVINRGEVDGVVVGMAFSVIDESTAHITDPETGEDLGGIVRTKTAVRVTSVAERVCIAKRSDIFSGLTGFSRALATTTGQTYVTISGVAPSRWSDGTAVGDPVAGRVTA